MFYTFLEYSPNISQVHYHTMNAQDEFFYFFYNITTLLHSKQYSKQVNFLRKNKQIFDIYNFKKALKRIRLKRKVISSCFAAYGIIFLARKSNNLIFSLTCYVSVC